MTFIRIAGIDGQKIGKNFETAIEDYLKKQGFKKTNIPRRSSSGYEVDFRGKLGNTPVTVECKAHKSKIDVPLILNRYTPQLCCGWDRSSNIFKREYTFYIDGRIKTCKPLCV